MVNKIGKIREKLELYNKAYISNDLLIKLLDKFAPNYTISQLCNLGIIKPIKRGKWYINNKSRDYINPFIVGDLYMGDNTYMYGGMMIYNKYGLSEQIAEKYTIYNTTISGNKTIGNIDFIFIRQRKNFFYGLKEEKNGDYLYKIMNKERAFIQALKEKKIYYKIPYGIDKNKLKLLAQEHNSQIIINKINKLCL